MIWSILVKSPSLLKETCICFCRMTHSLNIYQVSLIDGAIQSFYILANFMFNVSVNYRVKGVQLSNRNWGSTYFSLQFSQFCFHILKLYCWCVHTYGCCRLLVNWSFYNYVMTLFVPGNFLYFETYFICNINVATIVFF